jgi:polyphenol oxidase
MTQTIPDEKVTIQPIEGLAGHASLLAGFTARFGGVSELPFASLNMSFQRQDPIQNVMENYQRFSLALGIPTGRMVRARQVHGSIARLVDDEDAGIHESPGQRLDGVDALVTSRKDIMLLTTHADCVPIYLYDPRRQVIAMIHAGWEGAAKCICTEAVKVMADSFQSNPGDIVAAFGPHIGSCCFEVGRDVISRFETRPFWSDSFLRINGRGKTNLDLQSFLAAELLHDKLEQANVHRSHECTRCNGERYFSHRGSGGNTGCGTAFIMMKGAIARTGATDE